MISVRKLALIGVFLCITNASSGTPETLFGKLHWKDDEKISKSVLSIISKPESIAFADNAQPISFHDIPKMISLSFGVPTAEDLEWNGLLVGDIFSRPKAAVNFVVDGVPSESNLKIKLSSSYPIKQADDNALSDLMTVSHSESVGDHVISAFGDGSHIVSASADENAAMTGYSSKGNNYFYSSKNNGWMLVNEKFSAGKMIISKSEILKSVPSLFYDQDLTFDADKMHVMRNNKIILDLNNQEQFLLFAELKLMEFVSSQLAKNSIITQDNHPDLFIFTISSLKGITSKFSPASEETQLALTIVTQCVKKLSDDFNKLYNGNAFIMATSLGIAPRPNFNEKDVKSIFHHLKSHIGNQDLTTFERNLPDVHIVEDIEETAKTALCKSLKNSLVGFNKDIKLNCVHEEKAQRVARRSILASKDGVGADDPDALNLASRYSPDFPVIFNIWLWLMILLVLIVYVVSLMMWYMDPGRDSIIYRMTSQRIKTD